MDSRTELPYRSKDHYDYHCSVQSSPRVLNRQQKSDKTCCQTFFFFMFSHVGIGLIVICYALIGAFAFRALEMNSGAETSEDFAGSAGGTSGARSGNLNENMLLLNARVDLASSLWALTKSFNVLYQKNWTNSATSEIMKFQTAVTSIIGSRKIETDGRPMGAAKKGSGDDQRYQWTFLNSFIYSLTVITIIGFGGRTPKTTWGKLGTIIYAILGIPLMLLYLTNFGDIFARCFTSAYIRVCTRKKDSAQAANPRSEIYRAHYVTKNGKTKQHSCKFNNRNMFSDRYRIAKQPKNDSELKHFALSSNNSDVDSPRHYLHTDEEIQLERIPDELQHHELEVNASKIVLTDSDYGASRSVGPLPVILCLFILLTYVLGGAAIFSHIEQWSYIEGIYFSFVTLTTIGFGELVPGKTDARDGSIEISQIIYSVYLLLGMAIIAMCFNLIQDLLVTSTKYGANQQSRGEDGRVFQ